MVIIIAVTGDVTLNLNCFSAKPLLGHHALVRVAGFRMAGFMLYGSGIRAFVLGNVELGWGGWGMQVLQFRYCNAGIAMQVLQCRYCNTSASLTPLPCRVVNHCLVVQVLVRTEV